jgi:hypothetical protein
MKIILLMPTKNEDWILNSTLPSALKLVDAAIVSDQRSTDRTLEILNSFKKVTVIENTEKFHSNKVRWSLLDKSREKFGTNNLILNLDADEYISNKLFFKNLNYIKNLPKGTSVSLPWVQLWKSNTKFRSDKGVWNPKTNKKTCVFLDDGKVSYSNELIINDHTSRVPTENISNSVVIDKLPLIHAQFVNWDRSQAKQVLYQCRELINGITVNEINDKYRNSTTDKNVKLKKIKKKWLDGAEIPKNISECRVEDTWHYKEIKNIFAEHSIAKFKDLNIWEPHFMRKLLGDFN